MSAYTDLTAWCRETPAAFATTRVLQWEVGRKGSGMWIEVPVGFGFDVSVPCGLRWLFNPRHARYLKAACLHDYALSQQWDRVAAAAVFADALKADGVGRWRRLTMTLAVIVWNWR